MKYKLDIDREVTLQLEINGFEIPITCFVEGMLGRAASRAGHPDNWTPPEGEWFDVEFADNWVKDLVKHLPDILIESLRNDAWQAATANLLTSV